MTSLDSPESRNTHVVRLFGTNKDGDILQDLWIDIERIDQMRNVVSGDGGVEAKKNPVIAMMGQDFVRNFHWKDDPSQGDYLEEGNENKETEILKICDPSVQGQNFEDPDEWIPLRVTKDIKAINSRDNYQLLREKFLNDELNLARTVEYRRVYHYDTNIDDRVTEATDADPALKAWVVDLSGENKSAYDINRDTKDESQYIEVAYIKQLGNESVNDADKVSGGNGRVIKLLNDYLIDMSEEALLEETGPQGVNPPYILDPYQNIVNVSWGGLAVEFLDKAF